jgi:hypothetical protein
VSEIDSFGALQDQASLSLGIILWRFGTHNLRRQKQSKVSRIHSSVTFNTPINNFCFYRFGVHALNPLYDIEVRAEGTSSLLCEID